jgi:hypothetical protein
VTAKRFGFEPGEITLKKGQPVVLVLKSADVPHGLRFRELNVERAYLACFFAKFALNMMLIAAMPAKKMTSARLPPPATFPTRERMQPTTRFSSAQRTFTVGDDNPFPGGWEKGVGKGSPETPWTK